MADQLETIEQVFETISQRFDASASLGLSTVYQFDLTGSRGGTYHVRVDDGRCEVVRGATPDAKITVTMAAADYLDMVNGRLNPQMAFMAGKLKIKGDMSLALLMQKLFPTV